LGLTVEAARKHVAVSQRQSGQFLAFITKGLFTRNFIFLPCDQIRVVRLKIKSFSKWAARQKVGSRLKGLFTRKWTFLPSDWKPRLPFVKLRFLMPHDRDAIYIVWGTWQVYFLST
jgi:hypothetical protein